MRIRKIKRIRKMKRFEKGNDGEEQEKKTREDERKWLKKMQIRNGKEEKMKENQRQKRLKIEEQL